MDFPVFRAWCQKVIPIAYDSSLSYYEILCKVIHMLNEMIDGVNGVNTQIAANTEDIEDLRDELAYINAELDNFKNGGYLSKYLIALEDWVTQNLHSYVARIAKFVTFGLTNDGYFCAYIPESFESMQFDTIIDPAQPLYGHLIMKM